MEESKVERKARLVESNKQIARHASRKELSAAISIFEQLRSERLVNAHTYAAMLNAHVRCGDMNGAKSLFEELGKSRNIALDVIAATTMMKGLCAELDIDGAKQLLQKMDSTKPPVVPNIRTINTLLRGCVSTGAVLLADEVFHKNRKYKITPDISSYEYIVTLWAQGLMIDKLSPMIGRMKNDVLLQTSMDVIHVAMGRAAAILGDWKSVRRSLESASKVMVDSSGGREGADMDVLEGSMASLDDDACDVLSSLSPRIVGGKQGWGGKASDETRAQSLKLFQQHKKSELQREIDMLIAFAETRQRDASTSQAAYMKPFFSKSFSWVGLTYEDDGYCKEVIDEALKGALRVKFGLLGFVSKVFPPQSKGEVKGKEGSVGAGSPNSEHTKGQGQGQGQHMERGTKEKSEETDDGGKTERPKEKRKRKRERESKKREEGEPIPDVGTRTPVEGVTALTLVSNTNPDPSAAPAPAPAPTAALAVGPAPTPAAVPVGVIPSEVAQVENQQQQDQGNRKMRRQHLQTSASQWPSKRKQRASGAGAVPEGEGEGLPVHSDPKDDGDHPPAATEAGAGVGTRTGTSPSRENAEVDTKGPKKKKQKRARLGEAGQGHAVDRGADLESVDAQPVFATEVEVEGHMKAAKVSNKKAKKLKDVDEHEQKQEKEEEGAQSTLLEQEQEQLVSSAHTKTGKAVGSRGRREQAIDGAKKDKAAGGRVASDVGAGEEYVQEVECAAALAVAADGFVDFSRVFGNSRAVKMEVCSGAGEWAVAQAVADKESNWVTLELRHDRVHQTFTRAVCAGAVNLCVMGGDAMKVIPHHFPSSSVSLVCVNHPEPPQQTGGATSEGKHLLTQDFFDEVARVLKPEGLVTVVTDNLWYGKFLMRELQRAPEPRALRCLSGPEVQSLRLARDFGTVHCDEAGAEAWPGALLVGMPGPACGHVVEASSYFDRLWKRGEQIERYFFVLRKETVLKIGKALAGRQSTRALAAYTAVQRLGNALPQSKKIVFED